MVEAGEVDWANHDDNLDNSIGAVISGDAAFRAVADWVEKHALLARNCGHPDRGPRPLLPPDGSASPSDCATPIWLPPEQVYAPIRIELCMAGPRISIPFFRQLYSAAQLPGIFFR